MNTTTLNPFKTFRFTAEVQLPNKEVVEDVTVEAIDYEHAEHKATDSCAKQHPLMVSLVLFRVR